MRSTRVKFGFAAVAIALMIVASCSKKTTPTADRAVAVNGADVFAKHCQRCHGAQGVKDSRTPNLQTIALDKAGLVKSITNGKGFMPAFADKLSTAEIEAVSDLIVSWHSK